MPHSFNLLPAWKLLPALLLAVAAQAETADAIWTARWVVTMDGARRVIENGAVAVKGDRIAAVGPRAEILGRYQSRQRVDAPRGVLIPGLINTHTHAAMSLFRGIADDRRLQDWLENFIFPAEAKNVNADFVRWGTRLACLEMMLSGTTTFTDMYYFEDVVAEATKEAGLRGVLGQTIIGFPVADYRTPADALAGTEKFLARFANDPLITPAPAPHAIYTNSDEHLKAARALANKYKVPLLIHLSETKRENEESAAKRGVSPTQALARLGVLDGVTVGAHGVWLDDADIALLQAKGTGIAHCPSSNTKLASGIAPVLKLLRAGVAVGLGTDGVAGSNNDHFLLEEVDLAAKMQKVTSMDPQALPAKESLAMATILGARALGMEKQIGSIEAGKKADLVLLDASGPHAQPMYDVYSHVAYALKSSDVTDVMVNGKQIVRRGRSLTLDPVVIRRQAELYRERIVQSLAK